MTSFYLYESNKHLWSPKKVQCMLFSRWSCVVMIITCSFPFIHFRVVPRVLKIFLFSNLSFWHFTNPKHIEETGHIIPVLPWIWGVPYGGTVLHSNQVVGLPCIPEAQRLCERCTIYPLPLTLSHLVRQSNIKLLLSRFCVVKEFLREIHTANEEISYSNFK